MPVASADQLHARRRNGDAALVPVLLALPLGMALATGVEAPSNAIAQLGQLDAGGRRRFGPLTLWRTWVARGRPGGVARIAT